LNGVEPPLNPGPDVESEIWEQVSLKTTKGVSAAWMGSISGGPEPGGTAGGMLGWVEEGIILRPCPGKSIVVSSLVIQPLHGIDIGSGKWMNQWNGDTALTICICLKNREGERREDRRGERGQGNALVAKDQGVKGQSTRYTWTFSNCQLLGDPARVVFDGIE